MLAELLLVPGVVALAWWLTGVVSRSPFAVLDQPGDRSLHTAPVSRLGGFAVVIAAAAGVAGADLADPTVIQGTIAWMTIAATAVIVASSAVEDVRGLSPAVRLVFQGASAILLVSGIAVTGFDGIVWLPGWVVLAVTSAAVVWMANLFNFMDGSDGLAGGMALFGFGALGVVGALAGAAFVATTAAMVCAAAVGFLMLNFPPARVFLGDAGSVTLGFAAAALSSVLVLQHGVSPVVPVLIFAPFLLDATITLVGRLWRREHVWRPHRQHWYQRLVLADWSHRQVLQLYWPLMAAGAASAIVVASDRSGSAAIVPAVLALHLLIPVLVRSAERRVRDGRVAETRASEVLR